MYSIQDPCHALELLGYPSDISQCLHETTASLSSKPLVPVEDAAKKDPEQFKIWRESPVDFSFDGRYHLREVYDKVKEAWKGKPQTDSRHRATSRHWRNYQYVQQHHVQQNA